MVQTLREQWKVFDEDQSRTERAVGNVRHDPNVLLPPKRIPYSYIWMLEATGGPPGGDRGDFEIVRRFGELVERQVERGILPAEKGRKRSATFFEVQGVEVPVGVTVFPDELYPAPVKGRSNRHPNGSSSQIDPPAFQSAWTVLTRVSVRLA